MAKSITYDATNDILYADGGTEADPITDQDLRDADDANGWGLYTEMDGTYWDGTYWDTKFNPGTNAETHFNISGKCLIFQEAHGTVDVTYYLDSQSTMMGMSYPCALTGSWIASNSNIWSNYKIYSRQASEFIGCHITTNRGYLSEYNSGSIYKDCLLDCDEFLLLRPATLIRCSFVGRRVEFRSHYSNEAVFDTPFIEQLNDLSVETRQYGNPVFIVLDHQGAMPSLSIVDWSGNGAGSIEERWRWVSPVLDTDGNPLSGVDVTIEDSEDNTYSYTTNSDGLPDSEIRVMSRKWEGENVVLTDHNPFTITIAESSGTYATFERTYEIDAKQNEPISLATLDQVGMPETQDVEVGVEFGPEGDLVGTYVGDAPETDIVAPEPAVEVSAPAPSVSIEVN